MDKILKCAMAIQMKATEHFSDDVRFIMLYKMVLTAAVLTQSVERVDCRAGGRGFDSWGRTNTQGLKITEKSRYSLCTATG